MCVGGVLDCLRELGGWFVSWEAVAGCSIGIQVASCELVLADVKLHDSCCSESRCRMLMGLRVAVWAKLEVSKP